MYFIRDTSHIKVLKVCVLQRCSEKKSKTHGREKMNSSMYGELRDFEIKFKLNGNFHLINLLCITYLDLFWPKETEEKKYTIVNVTNFTCERTPFK